MTNRPRAYQRSRTVEVGRGGSASVTRFVGAGRTKRRLALPVSDLWNSSCPPKRSVWKSKPTLRSVRWLQTYAITVRVLIYSRRASSRNRRSIRPGRLSRVRFSEAKSAASPLSDQGRGRRDTALQRGYRCRKQQYRQRPRCTESSRTAVVEATPGHR